MAFLLSQPCQAAIRYVKAGGTGDGSTWANASADLQAMINASGTGDQVWVATGTYKPTTGTNRSLSFSMKNGVKIYGGFDGTESMLSERDWVANLTTLSGNIGAAGNDDNSYHVVRNFGLNSSALLDGFTISGGYAFGDLPDDAGGGIHNTSSSPTIINCSFSGNLAYFGGGMENVTSSSPTLINCFFSGNGANLSGGAMENFDFSSPTLINCSFSGNAAASGGGIDNIGSASPTLTNCSFSGNSATYGGGMSNTASCAPTLRNCSFSGNSAPNGGAMDNFDLCSPNLTNCILWGNSSGIVNNNSSPTVNYSIVQGGHTGTGNLNTNPLFVNQPNHNDAPTTDGDLHLQVCSPAINAGTSDDAPANDLDGAPRPFGAGYDMGAYESQISDDVPPTVTCKTYTAFLNAAGTAAIVTSNVYQSGADNCGVVNQVSVSPNAFTCANIGANTVTLTVDDIHGNTGTCTTTVTLTDNIAPTVVCKTYIAFLDAAGTAAIVPANVYQSGSDNCGVVNQMSVSPNSFTCANIGANTVTLRVNDGHGHTASCTATVTVSDNLAPTVVCKTYTAFLNAVGAAAIVPSDVYQSGADNCGVVNQVSVSPNTFTCANIGANAVTLTANDGHGNTASCTATVTVSDNLTPTVVCKTYTAFLNAAGTAAIVPANVYQSGSDNCGVVNQVSVSPNAFTCANIGVNTVTLMVNDGHGNMGTCNTTVTISDKQPPSITCPANIVRSTDAGLCSAVVTYATPSYSDNCTGGGAAILPNHLPSGSTFPKGVTMVGWKATDAAGLTAICQFTVTVNDAQLPSISCPSNQTVGTTPTLCTGIATFTTPTGADNCALPPNAVTQTTGLPSGSAFPKGQTVVTFKVTDAAGLSKTCTFRVTVNDTENPLIACPSNQSANTDASTCTALVTYPTPTATDNCGSLTVTRISGPASGSSFPSGTTNVIWRAIDGSGRSSTCSFLVAVTDVTPPVITCPSNISATGGGSPCAATVGYTTPTATDNCGVQSVSLLSGQPSGSSFPAGTTNVVWRATDNNGNSATCAFSVTVNCGASPDPSEGGGNVAAERDVASPPLRGGREGLLLSPNPATTEVQIFSEKALGADGELLVLDAQGRLMLRQTVEAGQQQWRLDLDGRWESGVYFVMLRSEGEAVTKRLVVSRL